ncbi:hypothetical protein RND81_04G029500 [Saponaria officinalis]|uniref:GTD-binding domain-containing protein n=2 Tax=Saponaria officinalis TaxID=3572 RepID=A0AAW1LI36_SAPOF
MGGRVASSLKSGKFCGSFTAVLASALLEWLLILMLIVYAIFGYLITRFARYCELPIPCLLCSRIDNILGGEKAGFYWDMLCGNHKLEISSLVYCHFHEKLVDVRGMCETCLFSFATKDKSNAETYRLLVGKLGEEDLSGIDDETLRDDDLTENLKHCCCCNELWNPRRQTLLPTMSNGNDISQVDAPLCRETSQDCGIFEKEAVETQVSSTVVHVREMTDDLSVPYGYTDLKITSDTESDIRDDSDHEAKNTQTSSTVIHVRETTEDPLVDIEFTELNISSDNELDVQASDIHDILEEVVEAQASSTVIHVRETTEDPLVHIEFTKLNISSDNELDIQASDIHDSLEEEREAQASSTVIHVRETTEDPLVHIEFTELNISSDNELDIQASDIHDSLEEVTEVQTSSTVIHVREKMEDPLIHFGFTELKTTSDTESDIQASDIHDRFEEEEHTTQASSTIIHVSEKTDNHLGYTDLKMTSDTDSDIQTSDIDEARALISDDPLRDLMLESTKVEVEPFISVSQDDSACKMPIDMDIISPEHSQTSSDLASADIIHAHYSPSVASTPAIGHGLEELNWQEIDHKPDVSASTELINLIDDISNPLESTETISDGLLSNTLNGGSVSPDSSKDANEVTVQTSKCETTKYQELESLQTSSILNFPDIKSEHTDADLQMSNDLELSDAYKLAVSSRGRQTSEKLSEQLAGKNSSSMNLDLKLLLSQFSRGLNSPSTGILSPRVSRNLDELKTSDSSVSLTMKLLQKRASLERNDSRNSLDRNESGIESLDFSTVAEIEGETELDRLKRQLEHDRRFMIALLKELEEERNASASATNEAMAMITRLQEEKAALQMEALHHLRVMEEQAEYDMDALDKLNDLITEKEKEIQNLEAELDYYRLKYPDDLIEDDVRDLLSDASRDEKEKSASNESWFLTQEEREYLSKCLRNLEKKLGLFSDNVKSEGTNGEISFDLISHEVEPEVKIKSDEIVSKEFHRTLVGRSQSFKQSKSSGMHNDVETESIVNEISRLNKRLQVLEADCSFIERAINALNDGHEELIQEIASHLRELHKVGIRRYQTCFEERDVPPER